MFPKGSIRGDAQRAIEISSKKQTAARTFGSRKHVGTKTVRLYSRSRSSSPNPVPQFLLFLTVTFLSSLLQSGRKKSRENQKSAIATIKMMHFTGKRLEYGKRNSNNKEDAFYGEKIRIALSLYNRIAL